MEFKCTNCGSTKVYAKPQGRRMGVYCAECNSWIAWTTYSKMKDIYKQIESEDLPDNVAMRNIFKRSGVTTMKCSKCDCLLFNSCQPKVKGQFDLVNANYCPNCGRELI